MLNKMERLREKAEKHWNVITCEEDGATFRSTSAKELTETLPTHLEKDVLADGRL